MKVRDTAGKEYKGAFADASADAITVRTDKGEVAVERNRVRRVQVSAPRGVGAVPSSAWPWAWPRIKLWVPAFATNPATADAQSPT